MKNLFLADESYFLQKQTDQTDTLIIKVLEK